jgi:hypothetical protein
MTISDEGIDAVLKAGEPGLREKEIRDQIATFREHQRLGYCAIAEGITDEDLRDTAIHVIEFRQKMNKAMDEAILQAFFKEASA